VVSLVLKRATNDTEMKRSIPLSCNWELSSPKVSPKDRRGIHDWLHYHAAFSARFVDSVITEAGLDQQSVILDPYVGSGTTCVVAKLRGISSVGVDLNPTAYFVTRAKVGWDPNPRQLSDSLHLLRGKVPKVEASENFQKWFRQNDPACARILGLGQKIVDLLSDLSMRDFLIAALLLSLRRVARVKTSSNPTWTRNSKSPKLASIEPYKALKAQAISMLRDLQETRLDHLAKANVIFADVRDLEMDDKYDAIITSPPYLTRIDYVANFRMENELLSNLALPEQFEINHLRDSMIGTVTIPSKEFRKAEPSSDWGETCQSVMSRIKHNPTKAATSYYYPNIFSYFDGIHKWLGRTERFLKDRGLLFIVVQTSYFKNFEIPVGEIFLEMGKNLGYQTQRIRSEPVRTHIGLLSPQQRKRAPNKVLREEVLLFSR
jgi:DNA modification methylase